jgi:hypothetical protein
MYKNVARHVGVSLFVKDPEHKIHKVRFPGLVFKMLDLWFRLEKFMPWVLLFLINYGWQH